MIKDGAKKIVSSKNVNFFLLGLMLQGVYY
jgi:hypothetical protein